MKKIAAFLVLAILGLLFFFASSPSSQQLGQIRYVNKTDPSCLGQTPCYSTIQAAVNAALQGDTIQIQAGTYREQLFVQKNDVASASESDRIVIEADPSAPPGSVVITGSPGPQCPDKFAIRLKQSKYITIRGLTITGTGAQAIELMGGNNQNQAIHIERNRIFGNGSSQCNGGITIGRGNPDTLIVNNLIYGNGRNGITFIDADGGPHYVVENTIHANQWSGLNVARSHEVFLINNNITQNGTAAGSTGGRFGVSRESSTTAQPQGIHLFNNLICGNRLGEIDGPALDSSDTSNLTPRGNEGAAVEASPGCEVTGNVYANVNGTDGLANTSDDDFRLTTGSPAIDRGMDPRILGLSLLFNPIFEADYFGDQARPRAGARGGAAKFDIGAFESILPNQPPLANAGQPITVTSGSAFNLNGTGSFDPDGDPITYQWSQTAGPTVTLSNSTSATPTATAPSVNQTTVLVFQLIVSDGLATSTASASVTVLKANQSPILDPIGNKTVNVGNTLAFTVSGSDPDGDALTFSVSPLPLPANVSFDSATRMFTFTPTATQVGSSNLTFVVSDGRGGSASETITLTVLTGLTLNITTPADGATVSAGSLIVRGTVQTSGGEVGVTVNGFPAGVQGNTFTALVFVTSAMTSLTATATTATGATASHTMAIAVSGTGSSPMVLHASPATGVAPLPVMFSLFSDVEMTQASLDADGDGVVDFSGTRLDQQPFTFTQPGVYVATATAIDTQGVQLTASIVIQVFDQAALDGILRSKWNEFRAALARNDIDGGVLFVSTGAKEKYRRVFQRLASDLPVVAATFRGLVPSLFEGGIMEYATTQDRNGDTFVHFVYFMQDEDGVWKIVAM